jgi:transposase-like protein
MDKPGNTLRPPTLATGRRLPASFRAPQQHQGLILIPRKVNLPPGTGPDNRSHRSDLWSWLVGQFPRHAGRGRPVRHRPVAAGHAAGVHLGCRRRDRELRALHRRHYRHAQGWSIAATAAVLGITARTLRKWRGRHATEGAGFVGAAGVKPRDAAAEGGSGSMSVRPTQAQSAIGGTTCLVTISRT